MSEIKIRELWGYFAEKGAPIGNKSAKDDNISKAYLRYRHSLYAIAIDAKTARSSPS